MSSPTTVRDKHAPAPPQERNGLSTAELEVPYLSQSHFVQGAVILSLIEDWSAWVHRRVEHVTLADPLVSERHVSLDFTLAADPATPSIADDGAAQTYLVPVTWIAKHRITKFSLRDESDRALPVLTQVQTALIATAILAVVAAEIVQGSSDLKDRVVRRVRRHFEPGPSDVLSDLWTIAVAKRPRALKAWTKLHLVPASVTSPEAREESRQWRRAITSDDEFMTLANDVARNFLIVTPLPGRRDTRRIIKLSYDEQRSTTPIRQVNRRMKVLKPERWGILTRLYTTPRAYLWESQRFIGWRAKRIEVPASSIGRAQCYHLEVDVPEGIRLTRAKLLGYSPESLTRLVAADTIAVSQATVGDTVEAEEPQEAAGTQRDEVVRSSQRAHLHLSDVPRSFTGLGVILLRVRGELVLRAACINGAFTVALLLLVARYWESFEIHTDATVALLLGIPGGVSLYLARPREPGMSAAMHSGVRLLALGNAVIAFAAIAVVLVGGNCVTSAKTSTGEICTGWSDTKLTLLALAAAAGLLLALLSIGYVFSHRPPEQKTARRQARPHEDSNRSFG